MSSNHILITGCSGGGKTTLINALAEEGFKTVSEPGRRIVGEELTSSGNALPWVDLRAFSERALVMAEDDLAQMKKEKDLVFYDRGLLDAALAVSHSGGDDYQKILGDTFCYSKDVFLAPPWEEVFENDGERKHDFKAAVEEYERISAALKELCCNIHLLPKVEVNDRIIFVLEILQK